MTVEVSVLGGNYAYSASNYSTSTLGVGTSWRYDTDAPRWDRQVGWWAWSTQAIGNTFPRWHMARLNPRGDTQQLINAWGMSFDRVSLSYLSFRKEIYLATADIYQPDVFWHGGMKNIGSEIKSRPNLLQNPSMSLSQIARRNRPVWWSTRKSGTTGEVVLVEAPSFTGTHSARMTVEPDQDAYLQQAVFRPFAAGTKITFSIWYMVPISVDEIAEDEQVACIYLSVMYASSKMEVVRTPLKLGTGGNWTLAKVEIDLDEEMHMAKAVVAVHGRLDHDIRVYVGAAQLQTGMATPWTENDFPRHLGLNTGGTYAVDAYVHLDEETTQTETFAPGDPVEWTSTKKRAIFPLPDFHTYWYEATPSRASASTELPSSVGKTTLGWYSTKEGENWSTSWTIQDNRIVQRNSSITNEIIGTFDIGEFWLDEDGSEGSGLLTEDEDPGFSRVLEALTVHKNLLWVVCKETEGGVTVRVLKTLRPWSRWPLPEAYNQSIPNMHLECIGDVRLPDATGTVDYLAFAEERPDTIVVRLDGEFQAIDLEYDYGLHVTRERQVILRHEYEGKLVTT